MTEVINLPSWKTCSICGRRFTEYGNNAQPINAGRCCDACDKLVIARRLRDMGFSDSSIDNALHALEIVTAQLRAEAQRKPRD